MKLVFLILATITTAIGCYAQSATSYTTAYNNFAQLNHDERATINDKYLELTNGRTSPTIVLDTTRIDPYRNYKYYLHFANLHNKEGHSYKALDDNGKSHSYSSTSCGIVFNYHDDSYWSVMAQCDNSSLFNESVDERSMTITLSKVTKGKTQVIKSAKLTDAVDLTTGFNYVGVQVADGKISVMAGENMLNEVLTYSMPNEELEGTENVRVGYIVGPAAAIAIERAVLSQSTVEPNPASLLETQWTLEALDRHFAQSKNPYEGYWTYLDRDMEDTWLKLGGRYTIALVETTSGYDLIYIDGAQVKKSLWHPGMKKGEMKNTIFTDNFTGTWIDATLEPISQDVYATFESGVILTIKFPVYKSQIRFSKVLERD